MLEHRQRVDGDGERAVDEPGGIPRGVPRLAEDGLQGAHAHAREEAAVGLRGPQRGGPGGLVGLGGIPEGLESGRGGRNAAGACGRADHARERAADDGLGDVDQPDGRAVGMCPIGGIFGELDQLIVALRYVVTHFTSPFFMDFP